MGWLAAVTAGLETLKLTVSRFWGGQTNEQSRLQDAAEEAKQNKYAAMMRARHATSAEQLRLALDDVNYWDARLHELLAEALAKWG